MKILILACLVLAGSSSLALAQKQESAAPAAPQQAVVTEQALFGSKFNELSATIKRNNMTAAQQALPELIALMHQQIDKNARLLGDTKDEQQRKALEQRIRTQTELAAQVKFLSLDIQKNKAEIVAKAKSFMDLL